MEIKFPEDQKVSLALKTSSGLNLFSGTSGVKFLDIANNLV